MGYEAKGDVMDIKQVKREAKANRKKARMGGNSIFDYVFQFVSAVGILTLAGRELTRHIDAEPLMAVGLAGLGLCFMVYLILAPLYRR